MKVVADSSPLILLSKTGYFDLLKNLYPRIHISGEVYAEVVVLGAGLPGASKVANALNFSIGAAISPICVPRFTGSWRVTRTLTA